MKRRYQSSFWKKSWIFNILLGRITVSILFLEEKFDFQHFSQEGLLCQKVELIAQLSATIKSKAEVLESDKSFRLCPNMFKTRFNEILDRFMETFVAPRMAAIEEGEVAEVRSIKERL